MQNHQRCFLPLGLGLGLAFLLTQARVGSAATFTVVNLADSGPGSLRQAVLGANAAPGADEVVFATGLSGTITLTSGEILISDSLAVNGPGVTVLTVSGNDLSRIFNASRIAVATPIDVTLSGLTLTRGYSVFPGGAVAAADENLTLVNCVVSNSLAAGLTQDPMVSSCGGNVAFDGSDGGTLRIVDSKLTGGTVGFGNGGNLCVRQGSFVLERSTLSGGTANTGGGLYVEFLDLDGESAILRSTIAGNEARGSGGAIDAPFLNGTLTIDSSTISGNTAGTVFAGFGGGIFFSMGSLRILNSTISGNSATLGGGGIDMSRGASSLLLRLTTVANNTAGGEGGGGILIGTYLTAVELDHSIVANGAPQDLASYGDFPLTLTADYSLIEAPGDAVLLVGANNLVGVDPALGPLAGNGGPTLTHRPLAGSPVVDAGNPAIPSPPASDQRGSARIVGAAVDLGSVEGQSGIVETPTLSQMGLFLLSALLVAAGIWRLRAVRAASA